MACFTVPLAEALIITAVKATGFHHSANSVLKEKLGMLEKMLYGGSFLLAIEHIYHGEVILYPPFLTAVKNPEDIPAMLHEMATVGVGMAAIVTTVWAITLAINSLFRKTQIPRGAV